MVVDLNFVVEFLKYFQTAEMLVDLMMAIYKKNHLPFTKINKKINAHFPEILKTHPCLQKRGVS